MPVIEVRELVKRYGDLIAVDHVTFEVSEGEIFGFLGPNGAGKTTTIEILEGLRQPTSGFVRVLGLNPSDPDDASRLKWRIGVLPQDFNALDRLTVRENIGLFCSLYRNKVSPNELIKLVDLDEQADTQFYKLSGGLKQRVGLAVAMSGDPDLAFLDEPTAGLDPKSRRETWKVIEGLKGLGKTIFLTTHYMDEAETLSDEITIINRGRIVARGSPEQLINLYGGERKLVIKGDEKIYTVLTEEIGKKAIKVGDEIQITFSKSNEAVEVLRILSLKGLSFDFEVKRGSIEDVFLKLIGARITEEGELK